MAAEAMIISLIILIVFLIVAIVVLAFAFWIWMIIDCARRDFKKENDKIVWILVVVLLQILVALIYYFAVKISKKK